MHAAAALIAALRSAGVRHLFGNPGTTELPFLDALDGSELHYVVGLQEATVVAAADGYAQATGEVGVANVHVAPGLANALSILHNAARARSPVLLTAGQQDTRLLVHEPILAGDLVKMAEPFTKWAYEIRSADEAVSVLGRAVTIALTPPTGPVFLSLPMDLMTDETDAPAPRTQGPSAQRPGIPGMADVTRACGLLAGARAPLIIAGDGVGRAPDGVAALTRLAEALGARVYGEPIYRRTNFPGDHSLWRGGFYPSVPVVRKTLDDADVILIRRRRRFHVVPSRARRALPPGRSGDPARRRFATDRTKLSGRSGVRGRDHSDAPAHRRRAGRAVVGRPACRRGRPPRPTRARARRLRGANARGRGGRGGARAHLARASDAHAGGPAARRCRHRGRVGVVAASRPPPSAVQAARLVLRLEDGDARLGDGGGDRRAARRSAAQGRRDDRRRIGDVRAAGLVDGRSRGLADHLRRGEQHVLRDPQGGHGNARPGWSQDGFLPGHGPHRARGGLRAPRRIAGRPGRTRREAG